MEEMIVFADLHLHTNCSDGKLSVAETIKLAKENRIEFLSITDHDSVDGVKKAIQISQECSIECVSGVELSCRNESTNISFPQDISIHILAYNVDCDNKELRSYLRKYHSKRRIILSTLIQELTENGFDIKYKDISVIAGTQMRIQDIINHVNSSFMPKENKRKCIDIANSYYHRLFLLDSPLNDALSLIKQAGGLAVIAHAFYSYRDYDVIENSHGQVENLLDYLYELGIDGIEAYYLKFSHDQNQYLLNVALERNLLITAGSDFHGTPLRKDMLNYEIEPLRRTIKLMSDINKYKNEKLATEYMQDNKRL